MKKPTLKEQLEEQAGISERLQARVRELENKLDASEEKRERAESLAVQAMDKLLAPGGSVDAARLLQLEAQHDADTRALAELHDELEDAQGALSEKSYQLEACQSELESTREELREERDIRFAERAEKERELADVWQRRLLKLAACCERALPPESLDESWDVACARRELREAHDACRNFTEVSWNDKVTKHTRLSEAYAWSSAPALLFPGDA